MSYILCDSNQLNNTLSHHSMSNLHETSDVSTIHVVDITIGFSTILHALLVDAEHDAVQLFVHFGSAQAQVHSVLAHFET